MTRGWHNESHRHSLAAKGVRTAQPKMKATGYADWASTKQDFTMSFKIRPNPRWSEREYMFQLEESIGGDKMDLDVDYVDIEKGVDDDGTSILIVTIEGTALSRLEWDEDDEEDRGDLMGTIRDTVYDHLENTVGGYMFDGEVDLPPILRPGDYARVAAGSGLDSGKKVKVVPPSKVKTDNQGIPTNVEGAYHPVDWDREYAIEYEDGSIGTMYKSRLQKI